MAAAEEKFKRSDKEAKAIKDEIDSIVKDLTDSGYDLSKEATKRAVGKGKTAALNALGVIGAMTLGVSVFSTNKKMIGTKYKLKDEKKKKNAHASDKSDESIAKRFGLSEDAVDAIDSAAKQLDKNKRDRESEYNREYDDAVRNLSKGSASDKAWAEVMKVDRNRNSYKNEEDYDRDRRKAVDEYERLVKKEKQR